jgi:hypothetical protein
VVKIGNCYKLLEKNRVAVAKSKFNRIFASSIFLENRKGAS